MEWRGSPASVSARGRRCRLWRVALRLSAICFSLFCASAQAAAGWLVIASTSPSLPLGTVVAEPTEIAIEPGAAVTLLAEDGRLLTRRHEADALVNTLQQPAAAERLGSLLRRLFGAGEAGVRTGGVRSASGLGRAAASCRTAALEQLAAAGCREELAARLSEVIAAEVVKDLHLYAGDREMPQYRFGEPIDLRAIASFEADLHCWVEQAGTIEVLVPRAGRAPPRLQPSRPARLFGDEGPRPVAAPPPGPSLVHCLAVPPAYRQRVAELRAGAANAGAALAAVTGARLAGDIEAAEARIAIEVARAKTNP